MALGTPTELAVAGATASSVTTASFTPTANAIIFAFAVNRNTSASIPTISDSLGGTWNAMNAGHDGTGIAARVFWQQIGGSPASMTVTVQGGGGAQHAVHVLEITGADDDFSNLQSDLDANGDNALTMSAYAANSLCLGYSAVTAGAAMTGPTGFTELYDNAPATNTRIHVSYDMSSPDTSLVWAGSNNEAVAYGIEVKELSAGATLTADPGAYSISGAAATLRAAKLLVASGASYAINGAAATLRKSLPIIASGGSYAIIGANATLLNKQLLVASGGSYAVSGANANLNYSPNAGGGANGWAQILRRRRT